MGSRILVIDIQQDQIGSVVLTHDFKSVRVSHAFCCEIAMDIDDESDYEVVKDTIEKILKDNDGLHDKCIISIPSSYFLFRTMELPFKSRKKISQILPLELESFLPFPVEEVESDFCLLHKNRKDTSVKYIVSVTSIRKKYLDYFNDVFTSCDSCPDMVTVGGGYSSALFYATQTDKAELSVFLYVESNVISTYLIRFGEIAFIRAVLLSEKNSFQSAKTNIFHTILSFNDQFNNSQKPDEIIVSGNADFKRELADEIYREINVPVHEFDIFEAAGSTLTHEQEYGEYEGSIQNAISMGLNEIKGVETCKFNQRVSDLTMLYQENKFKLITSTVVSIFLFLAWVINPIMQINKMEDQVQQLDKEIVRVFQSSFPEVKTIVDPVQQMQVKVNALAGENPVDYFDGYPLCIDLLNEMSKVLPPSFDIIFSRLVRTENNLLVAGSVDNFNTIDKMKNLLNKIDSFKSVDINSASMDKADKRIKFNFKILL
jgi:general secretion pathway protein L